VALALSFLIHRYRVAFPPHVVVRGDLPNERPPEGPPMRIAPEELARAGRERSDNGLGMTFCWCPPGSFHLGRLLDYRKYPVTVTFPQGFWMGKYEVTQAQWQQVMMLTLREQRARDPQQPRPVGDGTMRDHVGEGPDYPIYFTSHSDAEAFCRKLNEAERAAGRLEPGWEYAIPTEAQWEYACRAGTTTATAFGDRLSSTQANFDGTKPLKDAPIGPYLHETTPVGSYPPNAWGLHDMHGNLLEWCLYGNERAPAGASGPLGKPKATRWVIRGGCWHDPGAYCVSRSGSEARFDGRGSGLGFRVALVPAGS
jgi:formylglycine-generating enzyme required for sulfatase activity